MDDCEYASLLSRATALNYAAERLAECAIEARGDQAFDDLELFSKNVSRKAYIELENIASELKRQALEIERVLV